MTRQIAVFAALAIGVAGYAGWFAWSVYHGPSAASDHGYAIVDLKALGNFDMDDHAAAPALPPQFAALDGKKAAMDGFAYDPNNASDRAHAFQFVYSVRNDHHGPPRVQERVYCTVLNNGTVEYPGMYTFVRVRGTLHVGVVHDAGGAIESVYRLDVDRLEPVPDK